MAIVHLIPGHTYLKQQLAERDQRIADLEKELLGAYKYIKTITDLLDQATAPSGGSNGNSQVPQESQHPEPGQATRGKA